ncbi:Reverse transcriptase domain-containing protein [Abeliophyllum distichum]|uniref:Reverse transcriptase domain-containing protein n=1 Tax=Abeliophyllum distichum TaxID=126358 RepID=A0ABD1V622_9LAMI
MCSRLVKGVMDRKSLRVKSKTVNCCLHSGISNLNSTASFLTWNNGNIWSKLDRAMVNNAWLLAGFFGDAVFLPSCCYSDHFPCIISLFQAVDLVKSFSYGEIKEALFDIDNDKSPEPDGYSSFFFKKAWHVVGNDVCGVVEEFFSSSSLLKKINHSVVVLVPKSTHAPSVGDYRPISCCNVIYKIISKLLASRLVPVMDTLVNKVQYAFIQGRCMAKNIHLAQELLRHYNRKRISPRCMVNIDLGKAYDSVHWDFLRSVLQGMNFPPVFVNWIMQCVTTTAYSIAINGNLYGFFKGKKGLRQGDPLSHFCLSFVWSIS